MERISVRENGLVGTLFRERRSSSAIIILGGSNGGLPEGRAQELAQHGFTCLALAYFAAESLPPTLNRIPLEYFEKAIRRLQREPGIQRIGLWGTSRGAELALILGSLFSNQIHAIAAHVPSSVVYGTLDEQNLPAWTYHGKPFAPNAPFKHPFAKGESEISAIVATPCFLGGMEDQKAFAESAIPVEKIRCPLLLISAQDDQMWPSSFFAEQIVSRLSTYRSPISCTHLSYPGVGHAPAKGIAGLHPIMKRWFVFGGNPQDNALAVQDWSKQTTLFFKEALS